MLPWAVCKNVLLYYYLKKNRKQHKNVICLFIIKSWKKVKKVWPFRPLSVICRLEISPSRPDPSAALSAIAFRELRGSGAWGGNKAPLMWTHRGWQSHIKLGTAYSYWSLKVEARWMGALEESNTRRANNILNKDQLLIKLLRTRCFSVRCTAQRQERLSKCMHSSP